MDEDEFDMSFVHEDLEILLSEGTINTRPNYRTQSAEPILNTVAQTTSAGPDKEANYYLPATVIVYLVKELNKKMMVFVQQNNDIKIVCVDKRKTGESPAEAAQRVLTKGTDLRGPPEIEFLQRIPVSAEASKAMVGECAAPESCAFYVAMVRNERLLMRGFGTVTQALSRGEFIDLHSMEEEAARGETTSLSPFVVSGLSSLHDYLHPWLSTLGQNGTRGCTNSNGLL
eukprot:CAMPEP_0118935778 /NCGR_PEP_ID=MMETSP1169-20130426/15824_1 /TAXON_ID=36882 /ORGANISM="Pyramimonas obovata, Strain CCMP722" /LENGTH=228 /DNA_ID=CAMNT_0006878841 /DNA_START=524 /DNA_END=1210 /DNA_ORIENTATION=-